MFRKDFAAIALVLTATQAGAEPLTATRYADFDRYVLALSWQTGFCQSMYDRNRNEPEECRLQQDTANKARLSDRAWPVARAAKVHCRARSG
ncbi:ribonuclease I [Klebsiella pneumoniae subsp. ozaenae]|uniref:Ribonuclease I n=1 Tax=Klebsiella pneumoniae subsp. ozaenae TaxID=574 RepID=A0A378BWX3_KLEPO|nr:ribonuclease I [Klebsiella pneumoniae subsp. ozaenae]